jgi:DNA-binding NarL/FixJ family response regulator
VLKEAADTELTMAIHQVAAGKRYLNRRLAGQLLANDIRTGGWD